MVLEESDKELIEGCQRGEQDAFRALFDRHKDRIYSIALRYSGDRGVAEDIAQDAFLKVFVGIRSFRGDSGFNSWLYRLVVNSCFDHRRKSRRYLPLLDEALALLPAPSEHALDEIARAELSLHLNAVVSEMPDEHRMLLVLRYTQGLAYDEIAEIMGTRQGTVASRLNRIHRTLERRLARFSGGFSLRKGSQ